MEAKKVLEWIPDPRDRQGRDYRLGSILGLILVSMLCGLQGMKAAFHLGRSLTREQKRQLGFMHGHTPCHATLTEEILRKNIETALRRAGFSLSSLSIAVPPRRMDASKRRRIEDLPAQPADITQEWPTVNQICRVTRSR